MRLVVGLGNPGPRYFGTRHNLGFEIVEALARRHDIAINRPRFHGQYGDGPIAGHAVGLLKPMTFVNLSGSAVAEACAQLPDCEPARDLLLVYDDLDLPFGRIRLRAKGGAGGHNGVANVIEALGTREFPRLRVGIGRPDENESTVGYVLRRFSADERRQFHEKTGELLRLIEAFVVDGVEIAMNQANREEPAADRSTPADR